jgi:hypothetical protein
VTSVVCQGWVPTTAAQAALDRSPCTNNNLHYTCCARIVCDSSPAPSIKTDPTDSESERPVLVLMARGDSSNFPHILKITATKPLQLYDQIMEWRDAAFQQMVGKSQKFTEVTVFYAFRRDLGPDHIYNSIIDTVAGYESAPHMLVSEVVLQIIANFTEQRRQQVLSRHHSMRDARRDAYLAALDKTYEQVRPFTVSAAITRARTMASRVLHDTAQRLYSDFAEAEQDLAAADLEEARERGEHFALDHSQKWEWILINSSEGRQSVEAHMRHFDMMNGASSSSGLGDLAATLPTSLEDMPYRSPDDMVGINWLIEYCTYRSGGFSREDIAQLRAEQMGPNETPRQAAARMLRHASVLSKAGLPGYDQDFEVWSILTTRDREGGAFVTTTLFDHINSMVQMAINTNGLQHDSGPLAIQLWIDIADRQFNVIRGSNKSLYDKIVQEAHRRKSSNGNKTDNKTDNKNDNKTDAKNGDKSGSKGNGNGGKKDDKRKGPNMDQSAGQFWCSEHGFNKSHVTADCRTLLERQRKAQTDYQEATKALTTISPPGADLAAKGQRPNALYQQAPAPAAGQHPVANEKVQCPTCTRIAGKPIWHYPSTCYMTPGVNVPASFQPTDMARLKIVNEKRVAQGLAPWDGPRPMQPRQYGAKALPIVANDPTANASGDTKLTCCMIRQPNSGLNSYLTPLVGNTGLGSARPSQDEEDRLRAFSDILQYTATTKRFYCKVDRQDCGVERDPKTGDLVAVSCTRCNQRWSAEALPFSWASPSQWRSDGTLLASLMASPARMSSRGRPVPPASKMLASLVPLGPFGPTPAQVIASSAGSNAPSIVQQSDLTSRRTPTQGAALPATAASPSPNAQRPQLKAAPYPFKCPADRISFGSILLDIEEGGVNLQPEETQRILATLDAHARAYHETRLSNSKQVFSASRATPSPTLAPSATAPVSVNVPVSGGVPGPVPAQEAGRGSSSISLGGGMGGAPAVQSKEPAIMITPPHSPQTRVDTNAETLIDNHHDDTSERLQTDVPSESNPYEYVPRNEFEDEQLARIALDRRLHIAEASLRTVQEATTTMLSNQPLSLTDERFNQWTNLVAELNGRTISLCHATGVDPCGTLLGSRFDQVDQHVRALVSRVTALEQHPTAIPTFAQVLTSSTSRPIDDDMKALVAEAELRLRSALATSQAVDQVALAAETASSDLRKLQAECRQDFQAFKTELAALRDKVQTQEVAQASMKATYQGLQAQGALARAYVNSSPSPEPTGSYVVVDELEKLRQQLEGLHVSSLRNQVDTLGNDLRQQVADLQVPSLQDKLDALDTDIRKQLSDLADNVARVEGELRQATAQASAAPPASASGEADELRALAERVRKELASLEATVQTHGATFTRQLKDCVTKAQLTNQLGDYASKDGLSDYVKASDATAYATKADLDGYATKLALASHPLRAELILYAKGLDLRNLAERVSKLEDPQQFPSKAITDLQVTITELQDWSASLRALGLDWHANLEHDLNYLWEQVKYLKDDAHPGWRTTVNYIDQPAEASQIVINKRMINEKPVTHGSTSIQNYGAPNEPQTPYNDPGSEQYAPTHSAINPVVASAALDPTQHIASRSSTPRTLTPPTSPGREAFMGDARVSTTPKRLRPAGSTTAQHTILSAAARTALPADSDSVGGTSTELANALALVDNSQTSSEASPMLGMPPDAGGSSRGTKSSRTTVGMIKVDTPRDRDTAIPCIMARTAAELTAPSWGHPDWDALSVIDSVTSPRDQGADHPIGVATTRPEPQDGDMSDSSFGTVVTEIGVTLDIGNVPELRRFSPTELAELTALLKDETPDEEYSRVRKQLNIATKGLAPGSIEKAIAINSVMAPGTSLAAPPRERSGATVVAPAAASADDSPSTSHSGDADESTPEATSRKTKRNRANKRRRRARDAVFAHVPAALEPRAPPHISSRMGENFARTPEEEGAYQKFFGHEATSIMIDQSNCQAGFHLLNANQTEHVQPGLVMIDNGADLSILISPRIARQLNVTWTPGSANLYGIGGPSAGHSHADKDQQVVLRLGHFTGPRSVGPWEGCHIVAYRPIIMSESTAADIGCDVIFGQKAMRTCLATVDPYRETLDFSPAWYSHGCAAFRCSIPVKMARPISHERRERQVHFMNWVSVLPSGNADWGDDSFDGQLVLPMSTARPASYSAAAATAGSTNPPTVSGEPARRPVSAERHPNALARRNGEPEAARAAAARPHPGFPQTDDVPTREQMAEVRQRRQRRSRRNAAEADRRVAEARVRTADRLSNVVSPAIIGYPVKELQASGRLLDGFRLDLSGGASITPEQTETIIEAILPKLMEVLAKNAKQQTDAARQASESSTDSTSSVSSGRTVWPLASSSSGSARNARPAPSAVPTPVTPAPATATPGRCSCAGCCCARSTTCCCPACGDSTCSCRPAGGTQEPYARRTSQGTNAR